MTSWALSNWSLFQGSTVIRFGESLARLADWGEAPSISIKDVFSRLSAISLFDVPREHPWSQLHHCRTRALDIVADPAYALPADGIELVISIYETCLMAGYDGIAQVAPTDKVLEFSREELDEVAAIAWGHGAAVRQWWSACAAAVDALFGRARQ